MEFTTAAEIQGMRFSSYKPELCRGFYIPWTCGTCPQKSRCKPKPAPSQNEPKRKARA